MTVQLPQRFWDKIKLSNDCWEWISTKNAQGYGTFKMDGRTHRAHRLMAGVGLNEKNVVRHVCDNPSCVNPIHLLIGTQRDNVLDL